MKPNKFNLLGTVVITTMILLSFNVYSYQEEDNNDDDCPPDEICRCHTDGFICRPGHWFSFRPECDCAGMTGQPGSCTR